MAPLLLPLLRCLPWLPLLLLPLAPARAQPGELCRAAIAQAERELGVPARLLAAIGRVESGRRDPETGLFAPWPWTINAEGQGSFFPAKEAAIAAVQAAQARGMRSIDIGCMQVNLRHHPAAFASLEQGFDPLANARYAARFLAELAQARGGDWQRAVGAYHSATPELAEPYRARVLAAWAEEQRGPPAPAPPPVPVPQLAARPPSLLSNAAERAQMLPAPAGGAGRGLEAYRSAPIPVAGRAAAALLPASPPGRPGRRLF